MVCEPLSFLPECDIPNWLTMILELAIGLGIAGMVALFLFKREEKRQKKDREDLEYLIKKQHEIIERQGNLIENQEQFRKNKLWNLLERLSLEISYFDNIFKKIETSISGTKNFSKSSIEESFQDLKKKSKDLEKTKDVYSDTMPPELISVVNNCVNGIVNIEKMMNDSNFQSEFLENLIATSLFPFQEMKTIIQNVADANKIQLTGLSKNYLNDAFKR